jgi:hypothetical protein
LRQTAISTIHEASHAVVAMLLGYDACAWIFPIDGVEDIWSNETWGGRCTTFFVSDLHDRRMIAAAGVIGELIFVDSHKGADFEDITSWSSSAIWTLTAPSMSPTDWKWLRPTRATKPESL